MKQYKVINSVGGMLTEAKKYGIDATAVKSQSPTGNGSFQSADVQDISSPFHIYKKTGNSWMYVQFGNKHDSSYIIDGLNCPDCNAQAYRTDHPNVAACGATQGWFFFYYPIEKKKVIEIINGEPVEVERVNI